MTNREAAIKIIKRLGRNGFQALLAGGCVRDMLLGRAANDYDVATDARPGDVVKLFKRTLKIGAKFGVVIVLDEGEQVEVATFRSDGDYSDGRHPVSVKFTGPAEDASRRDFTINGMFFDPLKKELIDYVDGKSDLGKELIRTIGNPDERFGEDYLRMMRAVRFSTQLGFEIERETFAAIGRGAGKITGISGERVAMELEATLVNPGRAAGASLLVESGLAGAIFPGFSGERAEVAIKVLGKLRKKTDFVLALAGFFVGFETKLAIEKCQVLKLSRNQNRHLEFLLAGRGKLLDEKMGLAELKTLLAGPYFGDLYELQKAIQKAAAVGETERGALSSLIKLKKRINALGDVELQPKPLLDGNELMRLCAVSGPGLGQLAEEMYIAQLEGGLQTAEQAKIWARKWAAKHKMVDD